VHSVTETARPQIILPAAAESTPPASRTTSPARGLTAIGGRRPSSVGWL
jgi:hypothetical protein